MTGVSLFRLPCVHPNNSLAYHNLPFVHFVWTVSGSQGPRGPAARRPARLGSTPAPCGARKYITRFPSPCQRHSRDFFREAASRGPACALGAAGLRTLRLPRAPVKGDRGTFPESVATAVLTKWSMNAERPSSCERRGARYDPIRGLEHPHAARQPS